MQYNYSISLIRRSYDRWVIDPNDTAGHAFDIELSGKSEGDGYLASKIEGELSYCIFLSGGVCHSDVYGWIITMNGWQILDLDTYLPIAQEVWGELAQTQLKGRDIRQLLHSIIEAKELVHRSSPSKMDRNVEYNYRALPFTLSHKPRVTQVKTKTTNVAKGYIQAGVIALITIFCTIVVVISFASNKSTDQTSETEPDTVVVDSYDESASASSPMPSYSPPMESEPTKVSETHQSTSTSDTQPDDNEEVEDDSSALDGAY